jgi:hypothetical protein
MTYEQWESLTERERKETPDAELPSIPAGELKNGLRAMRMIREEDGSVWWEAVTKEGVAKRNPEHKLKRLQGTPTWYKYDPKTGRWGVDERSLAASADGGQIGSYGRRWMEWMETNHTRKVEGMRRKQIYLAVARRVDEYAWDYRWVLERDYAKMEPRPEGDFEKTVKWERTMAWHVDGDVMREAVLIARTS